MSQCGDGHQHEEKAPKNFPVAPSHRVDVRNALKRSAGSKFVQGDVGVTSSWCAHLLVNDEQRRLHRALSNQSSKTDDSATVFVQMTSILWLYKPKSSFYGKHRVFYTFGPGFRRSRCSMELQISVCETFSRPNPIRSGSSAQSRPENRDVVRNICPFCGKWQINNRPHTLLLRLSWVAFAFSTSQLEVSVCVLVLESYFRKNAMQDTVCKLVSYA